MNITWKRVLWWSFLAGVGFTLGAVLIRGGWTFLYTVLALDQLALWLGGR